MADLRDLQEYLGEERGIVIARELTKVYEEFWRGSIGQALRDWEDREIRGEFTLVVAGAPPAPSGDPAAKYRELYAEIVERQEKGENSPGLSKKLPSGRVFPAGVYTSTA